MKKQRESLWQRFKRASDTAVSDTTGLTDSCSGKRTKTSRKRSLFIFLMMAWPVAYFIFGQCLNLNTLWMAFHDYSTGYSHPEFVGFENFEKVFHLFDASRVDCEWIAVRNSLTIGLLTLFVHTPMSVFYAYLLYAKVKGHGWMKAVLYMPCIISAVVLVLIFKSFFTSGPVETIYNLLGIADKLPNQGWLGPDTAWNTIIIFNIWTGFSANMIFFLSAMNRIPQDFIEAAQIDGASEPRIFFQIILPIISRNLCTMLTLSLTSIFTWAMPSMLFMRDSSGMNGTGAVGLSILNYTVGKNYGVAAAYGMLLTLIAAPVMLAIRAFTNRFVQDVDF